MEIKGFVYRDKRKQDGGVKLYAFYDADMESVEVDAPYGPFELAEALELMAEKLRRVVNE